MTHPALPTPRLEFWFEFGSTYSYLSVMRIEALARQHGVEIEWKPFLLGPIFKDFGWDTSPFLLQPQKGAYMWRDMARRARKYGLEFNKPTAFPRNAVHPTRVAVANAGQPWIGAFCRTVMRQNFVEDVDINDPCNALRALHGLVPMPADVLAEAASEANKPLLRAQTEAARAKGIFGAPAFFVGEEMFWGDDRLEDALEYAFSVHALAKEASDAR